MAKTRTIKLLHPIIGHGPDTTEVVIREPNAEEFFELGEPRSPVFTADPATAHLRTGSQTVEMKQVDNGPVLKKYLERCITKPEAILVLSQCSLADAMRLKEEFLGFFDSALAATSPAPATSSSST